MRETSTRTDDETRDTFPMRHLVVGVDGADPGWQALSWAVEEAHATGAALTICRARQAAVPGGTHPSTATVELTDPVLARHLHTVRDRLGGTRVTLTQSTGQPADVLLAAAERGDLLVIGGSGAGLTERLVGSTAVRVAARATCPVVIARPLDLAGTGHAGRPFAGHVVVGVDGSPAARAALRFGFQYAERHRIPLAAVYATTLPPGDLWSDDHMLETHFVTEPVGLTLLATETEPIASQYPTVTVKRAVYGGRVTDALRQAAAGARLLVVGRHGHRLPAAFRLGSVSRSLAEHTVGPVAIVPAAR